MGGDFQGREPCPARILDDIGGAFAMGAVGGGIWHLVKGFRNAPPGLRNGLFYAADAVKARAPITGGSFATWGALFASFDCLFAWGRAKEDPWNSIMSGATTGGLLAIRAGPRAATKNAVIGGVLLAAIEGLGIVITKMTAPPMQTAEDYARQGEADPLEPPSSMPSFSSSSLSDIFGSSPAFADTAPESQAAFDTFEAPAPQAAAASTERTKSWYNPF